MERKRSAFEMVYTNSINTLPFFAFASVAMGEPSKVIHSESLASKWPLGRVVGHGIARAQKQFTRLRKTAQKCYEQYIKSVFVSF